MWKLRQLFFAIICLSMLYLSQNVNFKLSDTKSCKPLLGCSIFALWPVKNKGKNEEWRVKNEEWRMRFQVQGGRLIRWGGLFVERLMRWEVEGVRSKVEGLRSKVKGQGEQAIAIAIRHSHQPSLKKMAILHRGEPPSLSGWEIEGYYSLQSILLMRT